jgi:DNA-binding IclR family transcriptional regulator
MKQTAEISHLVPGLARGIRLLELMADGESRSLEALVRLTDWPKASVFRLLQTLCALGMLRRHETDRTYSAACTIVPLDTSAAQPDLNRRLPEILANLAQSTGQTAEWYVPTPEGLILVQRSEPENQEVRVVARIGFRRDWTGELEAVASIGNAYGRPPRCPNPRYWTYMEEGTKKTLSAEEVVRTLASARSDGLAQDAHYNLNGVRRSAAAISGSGRLLGILALAESFRPGPEPSPLPVQNALRQAAQDLVSSEKSIPLPS